MLTGRHFTKKKSIIPRKNSCENRSERKSYCTPRGPCVTTGGLES